MLENVLLVPAYKQASCLLLSPVIISLSAVAVAMVNISVLRKVLDPQHNGNKVEYEEMK